MKKLLTTLSILLIATASYAQTYTVERVVDGDTIVVTTPEGKSEKVRLTGIDCPESKLNDKAKRDAERTGQDLETINKMGQEATEFVRNDKFPIKDCGLRCTLEGAEVKVMYDIQRKDKYGRLLAYIFIDTGWKLRDGSVIGFREHHHIMDDRSEGFIIFLNASIIKAGYATPMTIPPNVKYADLFKELYKEAREAKRGLWKDTEETIDSTQSLGITPPRMVSATPGYFFGKATDISSVEIEFSVPVTGVRARDLKINGSEATKVNGSGAGPYSFTGYLLPDSGSVDVVLSGGEIKRDSISKPSFNDDSWTFLLFDPEADDDGDGLTNKEEIYKHSDPSKVDTDDDGLPDVYELKHDCLTVFIDEALPQNNYGVIVPGTDDTDGDGITNFEEYNRGTDPCSP